MRMIKVVRSSVPVSAIALVLAACASTPSQEASRVQLISQDLTVHCRFLGRVEGSSSLTGMAREAGYHNALNSMLNKAAEDGANSVVLDKGQGPSYWTFQEVVSGSAYSCPRG